MKKSERREQLKRAVKFFVQGSSVDLVENILNQEEDAGMKWDPEEVVLPEKIWVKWVCNKDYTEIHLCPGNRETFDDLEVRDATYTEAAYRYRLVSELRKQMEFIRGAINPPSHSAAVECILRLIEGTDKLG